MRYKQQTKLLAFICLFILFVSCSNYNEKQYEGKLFEFDFNSVENIQSGTWIKIDDWKLTHVRTMEEGVNTDLSLPTNYVVIDSSETQQRAYGSPLNPKNIGLHLGRNLRDINSNRLPKDAPRYSIPNPGLLAAAGILRLTKTDSSSFTITVPEDYPIDIRVLEE
ncbi:MAG: hypothetical protein WEA58_06555 [Balneolaceae bacterium]